LAERSCRGPRYAMERLSELPGVTAPKFDAPHFKELVVDFTRTGLTVEEVNKFLLGRGIFGGHDLSCCFPELGQSALYCITEMHSKGEIDVLR